MVGDILQPTHLILLLVVALLVLGPKRLPDVARSLGRGVRDFKSALSGVDPRAELRAGQLTEAAQSPVQPTEPAR